MSGGSLVSCTNSVGGEKDIEEKPQQQQHQQVVHDLKLSTGQKVEVSSNEEGFKGAWFVATVLDLNSISNSITQNKNNSSTSYLVQYETLLAEDGEKPLKEYIGTPFIRPSPPPNSSSAFQVNDLVDSFHRDAWWAGVVTQVIDDCNFVVSFQNPTEDITFNASSLRFHLEWVDGKWVRPQLQKMKRQKVGALDTVKVKQTRGKRGAKKLEVRKSGASARGGKKSNARGGSEEIIDKDKEKDTRELQGENPGVPHEAEDHHQQQLVNSEPINKVSNARGGSEEIMDKDTRELQGENPSVPHEAEDQQQQQQQLVNSEIPINKENNGPNGVEDSQKRKRGRPFKIPTGQSNEKQKRGRPFKIPAGQSNEKQKRGRPFKIPTGQSDETKKMGRLPLKSPTAGSNEKRKMGRPPVKSPKEQSSEKRKRGRPPLTSPTGESSPRRKRGRPPLTSPTGESYPLRKRVREQPVNSVKRAKDSGDASTGEEASHSKTRDVAKINDQMPSDMLRILPTLSVEEGISSQTVLKDLRVSPSLCRTIINQGGADRQNANEIGARGDEFVDSQSCWPFEKSSPLWTTIECMQVFKKAPQKPHFSSLSKCEEQFREGLAIGCMVTFASTVERIAKLQISDPTSTIDRYLETLAELEYHGFNVEPFRACLNELRAKKARESELQGESKQVVSEIAALHLEKKELEDEISGIEAKIREHKRKHGESTLKKDLMDQEITTLELEKDLIRQNITSVRLDFEKIVASPL